MGGKESIGERKKREEWRREKEKGRTENLLHSAVVSR